MANESPGGFDAESTDPTPGQGRDPAPEQPSNEQEPAASGSQDAAKEGALSREAAFTREVHKEFVLRYQADLGERVRRGKAELAQSGIMPGGTGRVTYGFDFNSQERRRVVNEVEALVVLRVFTEFDEGKTVRAIAQGLNDQGVPSKQGNRWSSTMVLNMLRNQSYVGLDHYGKTRTVRGPAGAVTKVSTDRSEWIRIPEFSPQIVPEDLFWRVQAKLRERKTRVL